MRARPAPPERYQAHPAVMGRPALTPEQRAAARARITSAAVALAREGGLEAVTMRAVAARLGVAPSWLYGHYPNRFAMLAGVWSGAVRQALAETEARVARCADPVERVRAALEGYARFARANPAVFRAALLRVDASLEDTLSDALFARYPDLLARLVREAQEAGALRAEADARALGLQLWAGVHGALALPVNLPGIAEHEEADAVITLMLEGARA